MDHQNPTPDPDISSEEEGLDADAQAMAAAMGFTAFGTKEQDRPAKKRRFDNTGGALGPASSGANSLPLHSRSTANSNKPEQEPSTAEEIDLGEDDVADNTHATHAVAPQQELPPHGINLPAKPTIPQYERHPGHFSRGGRRGGFGDGFGGRGGGDRDPSQHWWIGYYDPSSNENPWERLEQARGLKPLGPWLPSRSSGGGGGRPISG